MESQTDVDAVLLALKKSGGSADVAQLAATTGLARGQLRDRLAYLRVEGRVSLDGEHWRLATTV